MAKSYDPKNHDLLCWACNTPTTRSGGFAAAHTARIETYEEMVELVEHLGRFSIAGLARGSLRRYPYSWPMAVHVVKDLALHGLSECAHPTLGGCREWRLKEIVST